MQVIIHSLYCPHVTVLWHSSDGPPI